MSDLAARQVAAIYSAAREYAVLWEPVIRDAGERLMSVLPIIIECTVVDVGAGRVD